MHNNTNLPINEPKVKDVKPNESMGYYISTSVKITDPNSKEVLVQIRGDS